MLKLTFSRDGGSVPARPSTFPTSPSDFVTDGSRSVPTATNPPGVAVFTSPPPARSTPTFGVFGSLKVLFFVPGFFLRCFLFFFSFFLYPFFIKKPHTPP